MTINCLLRSPTTLGLISSGHIKSHIVLLDTLRSVPSDQTGSDQSLSEPIDEIGGYPLCLKWSFMTANCAFC